MSGDTYIELNDSIVRLRGSKQHSTTSNYRNHCSPVRCEISYSFVAFNKKEGDVVSFDTYFDTYPFEEIKLELECQEEKICVEEDVVSQSM